MRYEPHRLDSLSEVRCVLAGAAVDLALLRLELLLERKFSSDQPRVPAGQPGGGRWLSDGDADPETTGSIGETPAAADLKPAEPETESATTEDGSRVLTIRIHSRPRPWDEQSTVTAPDGESRVFETSGDTQTIRDGDTGEVLGRSTFTPEGMVAEPTVQPAFLPLLPMVGVGIGVARTLQLLGALFAAGSARNDASGTTVLGISANEFRTDGGLTDNPATWVGRIDQDTLNAACPRNGEVQEMTDRVAADVRRTGVYRSPQEFGNAVHARIAKLVREQNDPNFRAELSFLPDGKPASYGQRGTLRLDLLEQPIPQTVCVYDYKTGVRGLEPACIAHLVSVVMKNFDNVLHIIVIEMRPKK